MKCCSGRPSTGDNIRDCESRLDLWPEHSTVFGQFLSKSALRGRLRVHPGAQINTTICGLLSQCHGKPFFVFYVFMYL